MYDTVLKIDSMNHWESVVYFMLMRNVLMPPDSKHHHESALVFSCVK